MFSDLLKIILQQRMDFVTSEAWARRLKAFSEGLIFLTVRGGQQGIDVIFNLGILNNRSCDCDLKLVIVRTRNPSCRTLRNQNVILTC